MPRVTAGRRLESRGALSTGARPTDPPRQVGDFGVLPHQVANVCRSGAWLNQQWMNQQPRRKWRETYFFSRNPKLAAEARRRVISISASTMRNTERTLPSATTGPPLGAARINVDPRSHYCIRRHRGGMR